MFLLASEIADKQAHLPFKFQVVQGQSDYLMGSVVPVFESVLVLFETGLKIVA